MNTAIWRGIWLLVLLVGVAACSSKQYEASPSLSDGTALNRLYQQGRIAFRERRYEDAAASFARVVAADPEHLKARLNWAATLSTLGKVPEAIVQCQNVLARDPTNAEAYYQWGAILARVRRHEEAIEKFDQALALKPMVDLLQDDPALQLALQSYLSRHRQPPPVSEKTTSPSRVKTESRP
ncbi:MAG: tetratricopeptide repeat protein [Candidatus Tectimicrobiota bacterium]